MMRLQFEIIANYTSSEYSYKNYVSLNQKSGNNFGKKIRELIICYGFVSLFWNLLLKSAFARNSEFSK